MRVSQRVYRIGTALRYGCEENGCHETTQSRKELQFPEDEIHSLSASAWQGRRSKQPETTLIHPLHQTRWHHCAIAIACLSSGNVFPKRSPTLTWVCHPLNHSIIDRQRTDRLSLLPRRTAKYQSSALFIRYPGPPLIATHVDPTSVAVTNLRLPYLLRTFAG